MILLHKKEIQIIHNIKYFQGYIQASRTYDVSLINAELVNVVRLLYILTNIIHGLNFIITFHRTFIIKKTEMEALIVTICVTVSITLTFAE